MFVTIRKERNILPEVMPCDLAADYQQEYASRIVAVKLDNTLHDLQTPVGKSRSVEFVELESEEGWIIYRRTVEFLLIMAVHELYPEAEVAAMFRANNGLYCEISVPGKPLTPEMVTPGSNKKVWWQCSMGHVWKSVIYPRTGAQQCGCPVCAGKVSTTHARRYAQLDEIRTFTEL